MLIGQLCKTTGLSKDTVRHYDEIGLLQSSTTPAGSRQYKVYDQTNIERIEMIRLGKHMGFTLRELATFMSAYYAGEMTTADQIRILEEKLITIGEKKSSLLEAERYVQSKLKLLKAQFRP